MSNLTLLVRLGVVLKNPFSAEGENLAQVVRVHQEA